MVNIQDYIITSGLFKTFEIDDLLFVEYKCLIDEPHSEIWAHSNYLAYVLGGEKKWKTPENEIKVGTGEALFVKKGSNTVYQYFDQPFFVLFIFIPDDFIRKVILKQPEFKFNGNGNPPKDQLFLLSLNHVLQSFFHSLLAYFSEGSVYSKNVLKLKLEELVLNILIQPENNRLKQYFFNLGHNQKTYISDVMNANYLRQLSLGDFARLCARSLSSFHRDFKQIFGATPSRWLIEKRLEYSRFLLETTDQSIFEVTCNSGFKNQSHFIKAFKETFGVSPGKYREQKVISAS